MSVIGLKSEIADEMKSATFNRERVFKDCEIIISQKGCGDSLGQEY